MLVLTRKYHEKIRIGDNITITVLRTKGKTVRLGIEAPSDVPVLRGELLFEMTADPADVAIESRPKQVRTAPRREAEPVWATHSPRELGPRPRELNRPQVQLTRVSRAEVAGHLPKLVTGVAPLRAMMEQR